MGDSFHSLRPSLMRSCRRLVCSSALTSNQYFSKMIPDSTISFSSSGTTVRNLRE
ncbi:hypothetical protein D3C84_1016040 [compost metagenome]